MRLVSALSLALVPALALGFVGLAHAGDRLTDDQFVLASQCAGMTRDVKKAAAMEALVLSEKKDRPGAVRLEAQQQQKRAEAARMHASGLKRRALEDRFAAQCDPLLATPLTQADAAEASPTTKKGAIARMLGRD